MFYHAMRASSVAMCSTWVWAMSVLFRGLPLLFLSVSLLYVPEGFLTFWVLTVYVFRKGSRWFGVPTNMLTCLSNPELRNETLNFLFQFKCESLHVSTFMWCVNEALLGNVSNLNFNWSNQIDLWMQQSIYDTVAFWLKMCGNFRAPTLPGTPHKISIF